jgi:NAD(P)-dependent dehydrogenase (short-subunit alcohol dehydrogenase family)
VARTVGGLEELDDRIKATGGTATLVPLDLKAPNGIEELGQTLYDRYKRLDVLVGNAAVLGTVTPIGHVTPEIWREAVEVNVTANWRLIRAMDPLLRASSAGRAIFVTSGLGRTIRAYFGLYSTTKSALETMVKTYAAEIETTKVKANLLSPGIVRTSMRAAAFPGEDPLTITPPEAITQAFVELAVAECSLNGQIVNAQTAKT